MKKLINPIKVATLDTRSKKKLAYSALKDSKIPFRIKGEIHGRILRTYKFHIWVSYEDVPKAVNVLLSLSAKYVTFSFDSLITKKVPDREVERQ